MASRRAGAEGQPDDVLPARLLGREALEERRAWFVARGIYEWRARWEAQQLARRTHGVPDEPDPRDMFRDLTNTAVPIRRRSPGRPGDTDTPDLAPPF